MAEQDKLEEVQLTQGEAMALELVRTQLKASVAEMELHRLKADTAMQESMLAARNEASLSVRIGEKYKLGQFKTLVPAGGGKIRIVR